MYKYNIVCIVLESVHFLVLHILVSKECCQFRWECTNPHYNQDRFHFHREVIPLQALIAIEAGIAVCNTIIVLRRSCQHMLQWFLERQAGNGAAGFGSKINAKSVTPLFMFASLLYCLTIDTKGSTRWLSTLGEDGFVGCGVCWLNAFLDLRKRARGKVVHSNRHLLQLLPSLLIYVHVKLL